MFPPTPAGADGLPEAITGFQIDVQLPVHITVPLCSWVGVYRALPLESTRTVIPSMLWLDTVSPELAVVEFIVWPVACPPPPPHAASASAAALNRATSPTTLTLSVLDVFMSVGTVLTGRTDWIRETTRSEAIPNRGQPRIQGCDVAFR